MIAGVKFADDEGELRNLIDCRSLLQSRSIDRLRAIFGKCLGALSVMPDFTNCESLRAGSRVPDTILPEWARGQIGGPAPPAGGPSPPTAYGSRNVPISGRCRS